MPELPEVETIIRSILIPGISGKVINSAEVLWIKSVASPGVEDFLARLPGQAVTGIRRRGKYTIINLSHDKLLIHLRMSGDLRVEVAVENEVKKHDRVALYFSDGTQLVFNDPRKFGRVWLVRNEYEVLGNLGPDPFDPELDGEFHNRLTNRNKNLKSLLLDQGFLAGLGNIYTDESLFHAGLHPLSRSGSVTLEQADRLLNSIRQVLSEGIARNGASIDWVYRGGNFQNSFMVYQRTGMQCYHCGTRIQRIVVGQRGTHFCPDCQKFSA